jgi:uncharacterized membrane protein YdjX (TVP38/TMEM64 family)
MKKVLLVDDEKRMLDLLELYITSPFAIVVSIFINIVISVAGVIPSFFITAANTPFFGFSTGLIISFIGECVGEAILNTF